MKKVLAFALILFSIASCKQAPAPEFTYWVNGAQVNCMDSVAPAKCLQVQKGEEMNDQAWENFSAQIEGFEFEPGYVYKLRVKEEQISAEEAAADAPTVKYTLVEMLDKTADARFVIDGEWTLASVDSLPVDTTLAIPTLSISVEDMLVSGFAGCNTYTANIAGLCVKSIALSNVAVTEKLCVEANIEQPYLVALNKVNTYVLDGEKLTFYDEAGVAVLSFLKQVAQ